MVNGAPIKVTRIPFLITRHFSIDLSERLSITASHPTYQETLRTDPVPRLSIIRPKTPRLFEEMTWGPEISFKRGVFSRDFHELLQGIVISERDLVISAQIRTHCRIVDEGIKIGFDTHLTYHLGQDLRIETVKLLYGETSPSGFTGLWARWTASTAEFTISEQKDADQRPSDPEAPVRAIALFLERISLLPFVGETDPATLRCLGSALAGLNQGKRDVYFGFDASKLRAILNMFLAPRQLAHLEKTAAEIHFQIEGAEAAEFKLIEKTKTRHSEHLIADVFIPHLAAQNKLHRIEMGEWTLLWIAFRAPFEHQEWVEFDQKEAQIRGDLLKAQVNAQTAVSVHQSALLTMARQHRRKTMVHLKTTAIAHLTNAERAALRFQALKEALLIGSEEALERNGLTQITQRLHRTARIHWATHRLQTEERWSDQKRTLLEADEIQAHHRHLNQFAKAFFCGANRPSFESHSGV